MKRPLKYGILGLAAVWICAMATLSPLFLKAHRETRSLLDVFQRYTTSLVTQHYDEAYQNCGTDFQQAMPYDQFVSLQHSLLSANGRLVSVKRTAYETHGSGSPIYWRGVIDADLAYEQRTIRFEFVFHKEHGRWVLFGAEQL